MATVVNVPRDTRFGDLGRGFGNVLQGFLDKQEENERSAANQAIVQSLIEELGLEDVAPDLASVLASEEAGLDIPTQLQMLGAVKQRTDERRVEEGVASLSSRIQSGELSIEEAAVEALEFLPGDFPSVLNALGQAESRGLQERRLSLEETVFNREVEREDALGVTTQGLLEKFNAGDIGIDEFALGIVGAEPSTAGQILPSIVASQRPTTQDLQTVTFTRTMPDGTVVTRKPRLPVGVDPAETPVGRSLIQQGYEVGARGATPGARPTQFEQRIESAARLRGEDPDDPEVRDRMINLVSNRETAVKQLDEVFKASTEGFTREFETQRNRVTYGIALQMVEDALVRGDPLAAAVNNAVIESNTEFFRGNWIPPDTQDQLVEHVPGNAEETMIRSAVNLGLWLMNVQGFDETEVKNYFERSAGPAKDRTIGEPNMTQMQIESVMAQIRHAMSDATAPPTSAATNRSGFLRELFGLGGDSQ